MIDNYFYFDRKDKVLRIFKEDCYLRSDQILRKKMRILEGVTNVITSVRRDLKAQKILLLLGVLSFGGIFILIYLKKEKKN